MYRGDGHSHTRKHSNSNSGRHTGLAESSEPYLPLLFVETLDNLLEPVMIFSKLGVLLYFNKAADELLGLAARQLLGKNPSGYMKQLNPASCSLFAQCLMSNEPVVLHTPIGDRWFDIRYWPSSIQVAVQFIDVTRNKSLELEYQKICAGYQDSSERQRTRLNQLNLLGETAANIGHEIRNPLTTVQGFLQFMREENTDAQFDEYFELALEEIKQANDFISDFLLLSKDRTADLHPHDLNALIRQVYPKIKDEAQSCQQSIVLELDPLPAVNLDECEIPQLILNLARNGLEAMGPGGTLTVATCWDRDHVLMEISDEGQGIPSGVHARLGDAFVTTKESAVGLGLAVCFSIAARHHAQLAFKTGSEGTTVQVHFR